MPLKTEAAPPPSPIALPKGHYWIYFAIMAMSAALFGGFVYWALHKMDPIGKAKQSLSVIG